MSSHLPVASHGLDVSDLDLPGLDALPHRGGGTVPGTVLAELVAAIDPAGLDTDARVLDLVVATDRLKGWVDTLHLSAVAEFVRRPIEWANTSDADAAAPARRPLGEVVREFGGGDEVGAALGLTVRGGESRVWAAAALVGQFPATLAALSAGRIDYLRMSAMLDEASGCDRAHAAQVEQAVLARGRRGTPGEFRRAVRRAVIRTDPAAAKVRAEHARADLYVRTGVAGTDTAWLDAHLGAEDAAAIRAALDAAAVAMAREPDETRTRDQLRAAALAAPFWTALATGVLTIPDGPLPLADEQGEAPAVLVTLSRGDDGAIDPAEPGLLHGYGAITGHLGRELAAGGRPARRPVVRVMEPITTEVARQVADRWPLEPRYRPSAALVRHLVARDHVCVHPACTRPARQCDIDHTVPWPEGPTHPSNNAPHCRRHHRFKQHPAVHVHQLSPGHFVWTMPTGHRYEVGPPADG